jgi:hypothetical protein
MRIKILLFLLILALIVSTFSGCKFISFSDPVKKRRKSISDLIAGDVTGKAGETYKTQWFEFTAESIDTVDAYAGRKAKDGHRLYKIPIALKSVWNETIPMGLFDFYMDAPDFEEYIWAIAPLDETMMPEKFDLKPGETIQYVMIFEAPADAAGLALLYTENYANGKDGATYAIYIN